MPISATKPYETVKVWGREERRVRQAARRAWARFETEPGVEEQFDWKGPVTGLLAGAPQQAV